QQEAAMWPRPSCLACTDKSVGATQNGLRSFREVALPRVENLDPAPSRRDVDRSPSARVSVALIRDRVAAVDVEEHPMQLALHRRCARARDRPAGVLRGAIEKAAGVAEDERGAD